MVYIYKKEIGKKEYYYLRASIKKNSKIITKDIAYLGNNIKDVKKKLADLPKKYSKEIRKAYKTINRFIEVNHYLQKISKIKINPYINKKLLRNIEACRLHWIKKFKKLDNRTKQEILKSFVIEFAFNTTSIEGNTITLKETERLLIENLTPKNRTLREIYDLQNTEKVFLNLFNNLDKKIDHNLIHKIHEDLLKNIDKRIGYRTRDVKVRKMRFKSTPFIYVLTDMNLLLKWYNKNKEKLHPFVLAVIFHHKFEKIHPFMDGNGRTGRILMNYILLRKGYPPIIIKNKNRMEYINKLNKADKSGLTEKAAKMYKDLIEFSAEEMIDSYWNNFNV